MKKTLKKNPNARAARVPATRATTGAASEPRKSDSRRGRDPHYAREAERYENPLPSRELILETLAKEGIPVQQETLCRLLHIEAAELESFGRRLRAMEREGQIMRNRRDAILVAGKLDLVAGRVEGHPDGYGFLIPDDDGPDLFLSEKEMRKVLHGDRVMARTSGIDRRGRPEGTIVEIISRANTRLVGRLHKPHGVAFVSAENRRISQDILIPPGADMGALPGQVVTVEIVDQPNKNAQPAGRIVEILGNYADPGMEIEIALRKHELPYEFSSAVMRFAEKLPDEVRPNDAKGREDLRALPLVTI
ncbi:MAG: ribonuclease R, partial [Proteobacteria bacterium]|nr:ribonuclease R [Pseudomonadota bacterium]